MKYMLFILLLATSLSASLASCDTYEQMFISSAETFAETNSCQSQTASINAFKQLLLSRCPIDTDYVTIVYYLRQHPCTKVSL